jgi:hypothetical protein
MSRPAFAQGSGEARRLGMAAGFPPGKAGGSNLIKIETVP